MKVSKPDSKNDKKTPTKKQYRADNQTLHKINTEIKKMYFDLSSSGEICTHIATKYNKSSTIAKGYLSKALKEIKERELDGLDDVRIQNQEHLLRQYKEMLRLHDATDNNKYVTHALAFYSLYLKLFPNGLEPMVEEAEGHINITFNKLDT